MTTPRRKRGAAKRRPLTEATDATPMRIGELAAFLRIGKPMIYASTRGGYVFEFASIKMTTPGHYKEWLRAQARLLSAGVAELTLADQERQQRELHRLHSAADKSHAPRSIRGSRSASPGAEKSTRSPRPA